MCSLFLLASLAGASALPHGSVVVFDNTSTYLHIGQPMLSVQRPNHGAEMGDEVNLGGTDRKVVQIRIRFWYSGVAPGTLDARIRFRNLTTKKTTPGAPTMKNGKVAGYTNTEPPGQAFYESQIVKHLPFEPGITEFTFAVPRVKVPDRFVWTIQVYDTSGVQGNLGPAYFNPPSVGSSKDFFWHSDHGSKWIAYGWGQAPYANLGARIYAVKN